jgi:imidazolonepropionase-like amidohydrolase
VTLGTLESGKVADLIAVSGNPLDVISILTKVNFVIKEGALMSSD